MRKLRTDVESRQEYKRRQTRDASQRGWAGALMMLNNDYSSNLSSRVKKIGTGYQR